MRLRPFKSFVPEWIFSFSMSSEIDETSFSVFLSLSSATTASSSGGAASLGSAALREGTAGGTAISRMDETPASVSLRSVESLASFSATSGAASGACPKILLDYFRVGIAQ